MSYFGIPIRNGLPIGLGSVAPLASGGGSPFSPLSLFAGGAPGAWYDPSDLTTLFQDSAGTTPVTAVEQPVGLMLDKSQGLVLGPELVTVSSATMTGAVAFTPIASSAAVVGKRYLVTYTLNQTSGTSQSNMAGFSGITHGPGAASGNFQFIALAANTAGCSFFSNAAVGSVTNFSVKELPGNHAFQATSASRPVLSARYNQFISTENLSVNWNLLAQGTGAVPIRTPNAGVDPLGGNTATRLQLSRTGTTTVDRCVVWQSISNASTQTNYPATIWLKSYSGATQKIALMPNFGNGSPVEVTVTNVWQSFVVQANTLTSTVARLDIGLGYVTSTETSADVLAWGASLVPSNQSTLPYQRVNTATDYATTGFLPYLKFDGVDDSMSTNSISFTSTDKMSVFAGLRRIQNPLSAAVLCELSSNWDNNNGTFNSAVIGSGTASIVFGSKGTIKAEPSSTTLPSSPVTYTLTGLGNISGDLATLRLNGAQVAQVTTDQGTGNYGNYPLFIGRRNNSEFPFNGQLYSMVIVGKAVTAGELTNTETFVATKTGVTLLVETFDFITTDGGDHIVTDNGDSVISDTYFA